MSEQAGNHRGYKNYPTFCIDLHLHNNRDLQAEVMLRIHPGMQPYERAQMLKAFVVDELAPDLGACFAADLLSHALAEVDWMEIANAWVEEMALS